MRKQTPSSAAIAETVVRSIISRRNTYRAHRVSSRIAAPPACPGPAEHHRSTIESDSGSGARDLPNERVAGYGQIGQTGE